MQKLSLYSRPTLMLWSGLFVMFAIAVGASVSSLDVQRIDRQSLHIHDYLHAIDGVQFALLQMESGQRGYLLTGDEAYLVPYDEGHQTLQTIMPGLATLERIAGAFTNLDPSIAAVIAEKVGELEGTVALRRTLGLAAAQREVETGRGRALMTVLHAQLTQVQRQANLVATRQQKHILRESYLTVILIVLGLLLSGSLATASVKLLRREISARELVEASLLEHQAELARSNSELEQFAHIASHDLQEPLRMISSYTQLLGRRYRGKLDTDADEFIGYAVDGTKRMQVLINDLLDFSRVSSQAKPLEPVDLEIAFHDTLKDLEIRIEDSGAAIEHEPLPVVLADPVQIRRLLLNLIANAMKFQAAGEVPAIRVSAARQGREWCFGVHDNGIGIDPRYFKNLFQLFKRLHGTDEYPGTGIGLAVCKKIVERHSGRIWVESVLGAGSSFYFTLPAMEASA